MNVRIFNVDFIVGLITIFITAAIVKQHRLRNIGSIIETNPMHSLIVGVLSLLAFIPLVILLAFKVPTLALIIGLLFIIPVVVSLAVVSLLVGYHLTNRVKVLRCFNQNPWHQLVVGYLIIAVGQRIPLLGNLVSLAASLLGIGSVISSYFRRTHPAMIEERG